ncbi:hypothetical protein [Hydrogenophaga luteola]|uniref:Uncharacterized protein n=1 Tax=Hydrogenophaga luteola TaxID=1591122 RepID=A0ABV7W0V1_9BURK
MLNTRHINTARNGNTNAAKHPKQWAIYRATVDLYLLLHRGALPRQDALEHMKQHGHGHNTIHAAAALIGVPLSAPGYVAFWSMPDPAPRLLDLLEHIERTDRRVGKRARSTRRERDRELMRRLLGRGESKVQKMPST